MAFVIAMNRCGVSKGLKNRDTTDAWIDMVYPAFNAFVADVDGCTMDDVMKVLGQVAM